MAEVDLLGLDTAWLAIPLAAGAGALAVWLYLPDTRALRRWPATALPVLRAAAIVLMALILLQPILRFTRTGREKSTLIFFIDTSKSMSVTDTGISPARAEEIARGLKLRERAREGSPDDLRARAGELLEALEAVAAPGTDTADWRAGLESVSGPAAGLSRTLRDLDVTHIPASDRVMSLREQAIETAGLLKDKLARFEKKEDEKAAESLVRLARDAKPSAEKLTEQIGTLAHAIEKGTRRDAVSSGPANSTRMELALHALTSTKLGIIKELAKAHDIRAFALSGAAEHFDLVREGGPASLEEARLDLKPTGDASDLAGSVLAGVNEIAGATADASGTRPVAGVVVLSDGRQTGPGSPLETAAALGARGIPVYAVGVGSKGEPRDAAIAKLSAPESVFKGDTIVLEVALSMSGIPVERVPVTLTEGPRTVEIKNAPVDDAAGWVRFEVPTAEAPGIRRFKVSLPVFDKEATLGNNCRDAIVKVVDDKLRVTVVFEYPRWELRFLRNLIWRNRKMDLDVVSYVEEPALKRLGRRREEIMKSSVFVLDDVAVDRLTPEDRKNLVEFVSRRGGTIIMIAGPDHLPAEYLVTGGVRGAHPPLGGAPNGRNGNGRIDDLLPFRAGARGAWRVRDPGEEPFTLALAPAGRAEAFMRMTDAAAPDEDPEGFWSGLPGFFEYVAAGEVAPGTKVLLKVRETGDPILMVKRYGLGKVIFLAMHETWRWRYKVADRDHGRFWGGVLRFAAERPFAVKDRFVSLDADRAVYSPGEPVNVRARVLDASGLPLDAKDLVCVLEPRSVGLLGQGRPARRDAEDDEAAGPAPKRIVRRPLEESVERGGVYHATFGAEGALPTGDYVLRVESPALRALYGGEAGGATLEISIRRDAEGEFVDTRFSEETLAGMARASFGRYLDISEIGELSEAVGKGGQERTTVTRVELWSSYYVYALVLGLLSAEWILRKRLGLA